jgi:hypothetical protein
MRLARPTTTAAPEPMSRTRTGGGRAEARPSSKSLHLRDLAVPAQVSVCVPRWSTITACPATGDESNHAAALAVSFRVTPTLIVLAAGIRLGRVSRVLAFRYCASLITFHSGIDLRPGSAPPTSRR